MNFPRRETVEDSLRRLFRPVRQRDHQRARREIDGSRGGAQGLAACKDEWYAEFCGIAGHDGDIVAIAASEDMRRAGLTEAAYKRDLIVELRPERVDEDGRQTLFLGRKTQALGQLPAVDRTVVDDREEFLAPAVGENGGDRGAFEIGARRDAEHAPSGSLLAVRQPVGADSRRDDRDPGLGQDRQRGLDRLGAQEADDDRNAVLDQFPGRGLAALGRTGIVDDRQLAQGAGRGGCLRRAVQHLRAQKRLIA